MYRRDSIIEEPLLIPEVKSTKAVFRDIRNYLAGQYVGATRDDVLLDELLKCLFCRLYVEISPHADFPRDVRSRQDAKRIHGIFASVRAEFPEIYSPQTEIALDAKTLGVVWRHCSFSIMDAKNDPIADAFEVFVGAESRSRAGQFFTPRCATEFLVDVIAPKPGETIIDPACGSGSFLATVARNFIKTGMAVDDLASLASETFCGIDKDEYLVRLAKLHISLITRGHPKILHGDSLALTNGEEDLTKMLPQNGFDIVLTNPPFGSRIVAAEPRVLKRFRLGHKWTTDRATGHWIATDEVQTQVPPQVLFVERCLSLLKDGGRLGIVLPESLVSNTSYKYVANYIQENFQIKAVFGMPEPLFKTSGKGGTHTKTCILVAEKKSRARETHKVFMAEAKWCGHDSRGRSVPKNDLPAIAERYRAFRERRLKSGSDLGFVITSDDLKNSVLSPRYYDPKVRGRLKELSATHELLCFGRLVDQGVLTVSTGNEVGKLAYGTGDIPFVRTSDISNWEIKVDPKHLVDRRLFEELREKQDVKPYDILMVKDGTYLIGTCAILTEYDTEIVFQSHLYKIRVNENNLGLNPFLLLAILSSPVVQLQIRSNQFTQDIIDSLGGRIHDLVLPLPRSLRTRQQVSRMVKRVIHDRIEARELARKARTIVLGCVHDAS